MLTATPPRSARASALETGRLRARISAILAASVATIAAPGCGDDPAPATDTTDTTRPFLLGPWAEAYDQTKAPPFVPAVAATAPEAEALVISFEHLGLPWDAFRGPAITPNAPPATWVSAIDALIADARASGKTFVLALSPFSLEVDTLAANAREDNGFLLVDTAFKPTCFNPATETKPEDLRDRFARYAAWLVNRARPDFVVIGRRINLYEATCGATPFDGMLGFVAEATRAIRALEDAEPVAGAPTYIPPTLIHGLDGDDLYGLPAKPGRCPGQGREACLAARAPVIAKMKATFTDTAAADVLGLELYPALWAIENAGEEIPARYIPDLVAALDAPKVAIVGTGLPSGEIQSQQGPCVPWYLGDADTQARWLDRVLSDARVAAMPLVVWRSIRDLAPGDVVTSCPCSGDFDLCAHLSELGPRRDARRARLSEGLVAGDGTERPGYAIWRAAFE